MGIFDSISNKFKFSNFIDKGNGYCLGVYRNRDKTKEGHNALLHNGKVLADDITFASDNFHPNALGQTSFLVARDNNGYMIFTLDGQKMVFDNYGKESFYVPFADEYQARENNELSVLEPSGTIIFRTPNNEQTFIMFSNGEVSEFLREVGKPNEHGDRKVQNVNGEYYIVDHLGNILSPRFVYESEPDNQGNRIIKVETLLGAKYYVANADYKPTSKAFPHIKRVKGHYIAQNGFDETYFISPTGKRLSPSFEGDVEIFASGAKLIDLARDGKKTGMSVVLGTDFEPCLTGLTDVHISPNHTGVVMAKLGDTPVIFGAAADPIQVDYDTARLLMSIISGKKLGSLFIDRVIESGADVESTVDAFETIIDENLSFTPNNEILLDLQKNLGARFTAKISRATAERIRKSEKALEALRAEQARIAQETAAASSKSTKAKTLRTKTRKKPEASDESEK